ncbi:1,5-anhydro-D-fructose reductase-like [Oppia nitens]|uniref:1,5-anhydro-D-fructose reductase-like n=1 Tax=Oppia nitens TaxID=1686743 RepID=UPI0023DC2E64|nr:1,5-anhydro-D-fructose reductase-like [Oppia nitens]
MFSKLLIVCTVLTLSESLPTTITLSNGQKMPIVGLGTYQATGDVIYESVLNALDVGFRHIDTAYLYDNEKDIGRALKKVFSEGKLKREDVFVVTKLWHTFHSRPLVMEGMKKSLNNLGLDYVDLFLVHFPFGLKEGTNMTTPVDDKGNVLFSDVDYVETWQGMQDVYDKGFTKSIGLSNFNHQQVDRILSMARVKPMVNQVECHPYLNQKQLLDYSTKHDIVLTAYSPLGTGRMLNETKLIEIADKHNVSAAQVLIRYQAQRGIVVIPKATSKKYIAEDYEIFNLNLSDSDMTAIDSLNKNLRYNVVDYAKKHKYYPFNIPY